MPFALVQLCLWPACLDSSEHAAVTITDNALGIAGQRAQEGAPVGRIGACERLCESELGLARDKADAAENIESHLASGDWPPTGVQGSHPKGQMVEQQRPLRRPGSRSEGLEHDRCKDLHPVGEQLAMTRLAQLAGLSIAPEAPRPISGHARGPHVGAAGAHCLQRLRDSPDNELVVARRLGSFASLELPLAVFARAVPGLLPRQKLGEHVRLSAPSWQARIALSSVAGFSVSTVQLHARACVLRSRALHIYCARSRHTSSVACRPDRLAQRDARAGGL